jgi:prepilin-type N-terminal cleavage/methylation domain-containing protein
MAVDRAAHRRPHGFSLVELLMSIMILAIGLISVAALFPAGMVLQQRAKDDVDGPAVAKAALNTIRSRLSQEDFGAWTDFYTSDQVDNLFQTLLTEESPAYFLRATDWPWMRPAVVIPQDASDSMRGVVDVFNRLRYDETRQTVTDRDSDSDYFRFFQSRTFDQDGSPVSLGIPYAFKGDWPANPVDDDFVRLRPPAVIFSQDDRRWPPKDGSGRGTQYYWDFMLRRSGGKVFVAVFVYRAIQPGSSGGVWAVEPTTVAGTLQSSVPFMQPLEYNQAWPPGFGDGVDSDGQPVTLPGTDGDFDPTDTSSSWQHPGQWLVDNLGLVHRVERGRSRPNQTFEDGTGVHLDAEIPPVRVDARILFWEDGDTSEIVPQTMSQVVPLQSIDRYFETPGLLAGGFIVARTDSAEDEDVPVVDRLWFVPRTIQSNNQAWELVPVFVKVEQL